MHRPKVFLADDNRGDGMLLDLAFSEAGRAVNMVQAYDGVRAFELLRSAAFQVPFPFRLIVIDLNLPKIDGLELLLGLKSWPELAGVPTVILTSMPTAHERERVHDLHCTMLMKPDDYSGLAAVVSELVPFIFPVGSGLVSV
jgi:CheY-like chemotaxis protein